MKKTFYLLTGDIGGTNSRMYLYDTSCGDCDEPKVVQHYRNSNHIAPEHYKEPGVFQKRIITPFLEHCWASCDDLEPSNNVAIVATLAIAGVVDDNRVHLTNLGGILVDGTAIEKDKSNKYLKHIVVCRIINDFVAQGYGCLTLKQNEVVPLMGPADVTDLPVGPKICIGAGTGLGECYLTPNPHHDDEYTCYPSEGGHVEFAPRNDLEIKMFHYLMKTHCTKDRISVERVVSGKGLANVYEFLALEFPTQIVTKVHQEFLQAGDEQGRVVAVNASSTAGSSLCLQAMKIMMSAYGCEVGNAAIKWIPTGGLFVTAGVAAKNIQYIEGANSDFMVSYRNKGRVSSILDKIPLFAVLVEDLGVRGVHRAAKIEYEKYLDGDGEKTRAQVKTILSNNNALILAATAVVSVAVGFLLGSTKKR